MAKLAPTEVPARPSSPSNKARRLAGAVVSLAFVVVLGFFLFRVLPGDPVLTMTRDAGGS